MDEVRHFWLFPMLDFPYASLARLQWSMEEHSLPCDKGDNTPGGSVNNKKKKYALKVSKRGLFL